MDSILIYNKSNGAIEGAVGAPSVDLFESLYSEPYLVTALVKNEAGETIGTQEVPIYDPFYGEVKISKTFSPAKGLLYVTTRTQEELYADEITDVKPVIKEIETYDAGGALITLNIVAGVEEAVTRGIDDNGKVTITSVKRKRILDADKDRALAGVVLEGFEVTEETDFTAFFTELSNNYTIENNTLVKKG